MWITVLPCPGRQAGTLLPGCSRRPGGSCWAREWSPLHPLSQCIIKQLQQPRPSNSTGYHLLQFNGQCSRGRTHAVWDRGCQLQQPPEIANHIDIFPLHFKCIAIISMKGNIRIIRSKIHLWQRDLSWNNLQLAFLQSFKFSFAAFWNSNRTTSYAKIHNLLQTILTQLFTSCKLHEIITNRTLFAPSSLKTIIPKHHW